MKLRTLAVVVSSALAAGGIGAAPTFADSSVGPNSTAPHRLTSGLAPVVNRGRRMSQKDMDDMDDMDMAEGRIRIGVNNGDMNEGFMDSGGSDSGSMHNRNSRDGRMNNGSRNNGFMNDGSMDNGSMNDGAMNQNGAAGMSMNNESSSRSRHNQMPIVRSRYGGPVYTGNPMLNLTASFVAAGGGGDNFSTARALSTMVGDTLVAQEVGKLTRQYGKEKIDAWLNVFDFAVTDALKEATLAGVQLPESTMSGATLATALVTQGVGPENTFYTELMLDKLVTHAIHMKVMEDIDAQYSPAADSDYHRITNQAMYDLAQALGAKNVRLAKFH